jgi:hypothetical protein
MHYFCGLKPIPVETWMLAAADPTILFLIMGFGLLAVLWCLYKAIRI